LEAIRGVIQESDSPSNRIEREYGTWRPAKESRTMPKQTILTRPEGIDSAEAHERMSVRREKREKEKSHINTPPPPTR